MKPQASTIKGLPPLLELDHWSFPGALLLVLGPLGEDRM